MLKQLEFSAPEEQPIQDQAGQMGAVCVAGVWRQVGPRVRDSNCKKQKQQIKPHTLMAF